MTLDPSVNTLTDIHDEGPDDAETVAITWLRPLLPDGRVANSRLSTDPVPFIVVSMFTGTESVECSGVDDVVSVHSLYPKGLGNSGMSAAKQFAAIVHRRMLELALHLEPVVIGGRAADIDYCDVFMRPRWEPYGDEQILRKIGRYRIGLSYAKLS